MIKIMIISEVMMINSNNLKNLFKLFATRIKVEVNPNN